VVLVVTQYNFPEPSTDIGDAIMHPALKLNLDGFKLHNHSLFRSNPPDGEGFALVALPTVVGKAQEGESLWFFLSPRFPVASGEPPELGHRARGKNPRPAVELALRNLLTEGL